MTKTADHLAGLPGDPLDRAIQLLGMAHEQLELAQGGAGMHLEDALVEAADMVDEQQAKIAHQVRTLAPAEPPRCAL